MPVSAILKKLRAANKGLKINDITDKSFEKYGRILKGFNAKKSIAFSKKNAVVKDDIVYEPSVAGLEKDRTFLSSVKSEVFGGMPIQSGWCYGRNSMLDGLEYHKGIEVIVAVTDLVVILGDQRDIKWQKGKPTYSSSKAEVFYIKKNTVVELHCWCLHFAPIHVKGKDGFCSIVVLPDKTNTNLRVKPKKKGEGDMLFATNKWLVVHKSAKGLVKDGACSGIVGRNTKVNGI
ncbi:MAG: DUF4867 family protein [Planctomycetota bacterium]